MNDIPEVNMTLISLPIVAKAKKMSGDWTFKEGRGIFGDATGRYYYETVEMSDDITRYYARGAFYQKYDKEYEKIVKKWIKQKFLGPKSGLTILREGSNFYDVISTRKLEGINR